MGGRFHLPPLRRKRILGDGERLGDLHDLRVQRLRDSWNNLRKHAQTIDVVVQGYVVDNFAQNRSECSEHAEGTGFG